MALLLVGCDGDERVVDERAPVVGGAGAITVENRTSSSVELSWSAATDDTSAAAALEYRVFYSTSDNLNSVAQIETHGSPAGDWTAGLSTLVVDGLSLRSDFYFNVIVRDEADNRAAYQAVKTATFDGTWQEIEPLENYTDGEINYSYLAMAPSGEAVVYWGNAYFTYSAGPGQSWTEPASWNEGDSAYYLDVRGGKVYGASFQQNDDDSYDINFSITHSGSSTWNSWKVATGHGSRGDLSSCLADNGDAAVFWVSAPSGPSGDTEGVWVSRYSAASDTWRDPDLVTENAERNLESLAYACKPDGSYLLAWYDNIDAKVYARVYDGVAGAWKGAAVPLNQDIYESWSVEVASTSGAGFVAAWQESYDIDDTTVYAVVVKRFDGTAWDTHVTEISASQEVAHNLRMASSGDHVHLVWYRADQLRVSRYDPALGNWTWAELLTDASPDDFAIAVNLRGNAIAVWGASEMVKTQRFWAATQEWEEPSTVLKEPPHPVSSGSLRVGYDMLGRALVIWTARTATEPQSSVWGRWFY